MPVSVKRFRVFNREELTRPFEADTTDEIYSYLKQHKNIDDLFVDDVIDDIEIDATEFVVPFDNGEGPGDLQFY